MAPLDKKFFPDGEDWLMGYYNDAGEMFDSFQFFSQYISKRFPAVKTEHPHSARSVFLLEKVRVIFSDACQQRILHIAYGEGTLIIELPDRGDYTDDIRDMIREQYEQKYASILMESHVRTMALLWRNLSEEARIKIRHELKLGSQLIQLKS